MTSLKEAFGLQYPDSNYIKPVQQFPNQAKFAELREKVLNSSSEKSFEERITMVFDEYNLTNEERTYFTEFLMNEEKPYGPLTLFMENPAMTMIHVNGPYDIYVEVDGILVKEQEMLFVDEQHLKRTIQKIVRDALPMYDETSCVIHCKLKDGAKLHAIFPPIANGGPVLTILKKNISVHGFEDYLRMGSLTPYMASFLATCAKEKCNIFVCGSIGSGKTSLLNALINQVGEEERIAVIGDYDEFMISKPQVLTFAFQDRMIERGALLQNVLNLYPDYLLYSEVTEKDALPFLQALHSGFKGMTSIYGSSSMDALQRLETLLMMNEIQTDTARQFIANTIDLVVYVKRMADGKRKITEISEIESVQDGEYRLRKIFEFQEKGITDTKEVRGEYIFYDKELPNVYSYIKSRGCDDLDFMFRS